MILLHSIRTFYPASIDVGSSSLFYYSVCIFFYSLLKIKNPSPPKHAPIHSHSHSSSSIIIVVVVIIVCLLRTSRDGHGETKKIGKKKKNRELLAEPPSRLARAMHQSKAGTLKMIYHPPLTPIEMQVQIQIRKLSCLCRVMWSVVRVLRLSRW